MGTRLDQQSSYLCTCSSELCVRCDELMNQTKRVVTPGEELTFDYGDASRAGQPEGHDSVSTANGIARTRCLCGTQLCKGWMPYDPTL